MPNTFSAESRVSLERYFQVEGDALSRVSLAEGPLNGLLAAAFLLTPQITLGRALPSTITISRTAASGPVHRLSAGTVLHHRLKTPVRTTSSHPDETVKAEVERSVWTGADVEIPVGAIVSGTVAKLIPSSNAADRAKLLLHFSSLTLPGRSLVPLSSHVNDVRNARAKVLPEGTIQGVPANEPPVTLLNSAIAKLEKRTGRTPAAEQAGGKWFGSPDTSINYPAGTEFSAVLDKPLEVTGRFKPLFASRIPDNLKEVVM